MVRIRMQRQGRRNAPFFRINAVDQRARRDGRVIEALGFFDPLTSDPTKAIKLNAERIQYWLSVGAQPTDTVRDMLARADLLPAKMKQEWEADRKARVEAVAKRKAAEAAAAAEGEKKDEKPAQ